MFIEGVAEDGAKLPWRTWHLPNNFLFLLCAACCALRRQGRLGDEGSENGDGDELDVRKSTIETGVFGGALWGETGGLICAQHRLMSDWVSVSLVVIKPTSQAAPALAVLFTLTKESNEQRIINRWMILRIALDAWQVRLMGGLMGGGSRWCGVCKTSDWERPGT